MENPLALIVEDEKDIARIFAKALRGGGYTTEIAYAGDEAIEWLATNIPMLIVLDLQMPRVSGAEVLAHIRAQPQLSEVVVIIATAYPHIAEELSNQADHVLFKPVSFAELRALAARFDPNRLEGQSLERGSGEPV